MSYYPQIDTMVNDTYNNIGNSSLASNISFTNKLWCILLLFNQ